MICELDMAPELLDKEIGEKVGFSPKVDIFSLSAVFYFLSFHEHAFRGSTDFF